MFFILSKTLNYLTMPMVVITLCFILSAIIKKQKLKKWSFRIGLGLLLFCTNEFIANEAIRMWELPATPFSTVPAGYEVGVLLTGVARSEVEPLDRIHFARGADRAVHTVYLYKKGLIKKVLISGGEGRLLTKGTSEAEDLSKALVMMGIPESDHMIEGQSRNTHESAVAVKEMLASLQISPDRCMLITSGFHMRRSRACFAKAGIPMTTFTAETLAHKRLFTFDVLFIPKLEAMATWHTLVKEWMGMIAYKLAGYI